MTNWVPFRSLASYHLSLAPFLLSLGLFSLSCQPGAAQTPEKPAESNVGTANLPPNPFPNRVPAADLEGGVEWLNASGPLSIKDLRGKIVLLDFWTFCCINCMHVLPDLAYLEKKYDKQIVVIGVHSAKFDNEKETGNIRKAILRYHIEHPVVNDANMTIWRKFGVRAWPTLVLLDPEGYYCGFLSGEGNRDVLDTVIAKVIDYHRAKGTLDETPIQFDLEKDKAPRTPLRFPGKLLADTANNRLFISDSNNHRIVVASLEGKLIETIGCGQLGAVDGDYATARFDRPQGMCLNGDKLYVADTENHLIRVVDLTQKTVNTLAGTGSQARGREVGGALRQTALNSPWDVEIVDGVLYVAMAGPHQIWSHKLTSGDIQVYAGSGREDVKNGSLSEAALAQPSDLVSDGSSFYVADSEGSSIRKITTRSVNNLRNPAGRVTTIVGSSDLPMGRCLFEFGDIDGKGAEVRLQHPLGLELSGDTLYIADTYNHKIKAVDLKTNEARTWLGTGQEGTSLDPVQFAEPSGLALAGKTLFVADTNNHRIVAVDVESQTAKLFEVEGLTPPAEQAQELVGAVVGDVMILEPIKVAGGTELKFEIQLKLPPEHKVNPAIPTTLQLIPQGDQSLIAGENLKTRLEAVATETGLSVTVPLAQNAGTGNYEIRLVVPYCRDTTSGLCRLGQKTWQIPLTLDPAATAQSITLTADFTGE